MKQCILLTLLLSTYTLSAQNPDSLIESGLRQFNQHDFPRAQLTFEKAMGLYTEQGDSLKVADCLTMIGSCLHIQGWNYLSKYREAEIIYDALNNRMTEHAIIKNRLGKYQESIAILENLEETSWNLCWLGVNYRMLEQYDSAIYYYTKAIPLPRERRKQWPYKDLAIVYTELGDFDTAEEYFDLVVSNVESSDSVYLFDTYTWIGEMYLKQEKPLKAIDAFIKIPFSVKSNFVVVERNRDGLKAAETQARIMRSEVLIGVIITALLILTVVLWHHKQGISKLRNRLVYIEEYTTILLTMLGLANSNIKHQNLDDAAKDVKTAERMAKYLKDRAS